MYRDRKELYERLLRDAASDIFNELEEVGIDTNEVSLEIKLINAEFKDKIIIEM